MTKPLTFEQASNALWQHLEARDWHDNPARSVAISIVLEATELLEHFQWGDEPVGGKEAIAAELADIFNYCFQLAKLYDIDIPAALEKKLTVAAQKYPAEAFKGKPKSEQNKVWIDSKLKHKKSGL